MGEGLTVTMNNCPPQAAANEESSRAQQQVLALEQRCTERVQALEAQLAALESARAADRTATEREVVREEVRPASGAPGHTVLGHQGVDRKTTSPPLN